jgi:hypothetical protein
MRMKRKMMRISVPPFQTTLGAINLIVKKLKVIGISLNLNTEISSHQWKTSD